jgi:hypothetical protein
MSNSNKNKSMNNNNKESKNSNTPRQEKEVQPKEVQHKEVKSENVSIDHSFFQVNTTISKFVFILLILIVFVVLFHLGLYALQYIYGSTRSPYLVNGMVESNQEMIISSNPNISNSVPIMRSVNELTGIEYTWSLWFYIEDPFLNSGNPYKRLFSKGTYSLYDSLEHYNVTFLNNSPGLYYDEENNHLLLVINTYSENETIYETIEIDDIPIEKWVQTMITLKDKKVNVYINGIMTKEHILLNVPKQNYYDTTIGDKKGFGGYISNLRYYDYAVSEETIQNIMASGPNLTQITNKKVYDTPPWLSMNWYYN